eukprot:g14817.t1
MPPTIAQDGSVPKKKIKLKLEYNGGKRVAVVYEGYTFERLHKRLCEDFKFDVVLEYEDSDGDMLMLNCENDLSELLENEEGTVRVQVSALQDQQPVPQPPPPRVAEPFDADQQFLKELQLANDKPPPPPPPPPSFPSAASPSAFAHVANPRGWGWRGEPRTNVPDRVAMSSHSKSRGGGGGNGGPGGSPLVFGGAGVSRPTRELGSEGSSRWQPGDVVDPVRWLRGDVIGEGAFGIVHMGLNLDTGELMAVKRIGLDKGEMTSRDAEAFRNEVAILQDNKHENIVKSYGSSIKDKQMYIFLEYMPGGSVRRLLDHFGVFPDKIVLLYAKQLLRGLSFLHDNGVAHRDIKCANCLVDHRGSIKLADFGVSKRIVGLSGSVSGVQSVKGTPFWMAPEVLQVQNLRGGWMKADVWSFGATVLEMCSGSPPWGTIGPLAAMFKISCTRDLPAIPDTVDPPTQDLMRQCFCRDPSLRPDADKLLRHPSIAVVVADHASSASSSNFGGRPPHQQTTAVPAAAREQGLQVSRSGLPGGDNSVAARDTGGMSDSDSSVSAISPTGHSRAGHAQQAVSNPLDLLTTKPRPQARTKWGSIGGGGGGSVGATNNTKPPTVEEGRESQSSTSTRGNNSGASAGGAHSCGYRGGSSIMMQAPLGALGDSGNADTSERAPSPAGTTEVTLPTPSRDDSDAVSCSPASSSAASSASSSSSSAPLACVSRASLSGGSGGGDGGASSGSTVLAGGLQAHRRQGSGHSVASSNRSSGNETLGVTSAPVAAAGAAAAAGAGAAHPQKKSFGPNRSEWGWRDGAPVPGGRRLTPTNSPTGESPRSAGNEQVPAAATSSGNLSVSPSLSLRSSGSWGSGRGVKVGTTATARATAWKRRIQERGLESEAERMASTYNSDRARGNSDTSDGTAASDAGGRRPQYGAPRSGSGTSSSDKSTSGRAPKPSLFQWSQESLQEPRLGAGYSASPPSGSLTSVDLGRSGGGGGGTSDGVADHSDRAPIPEKVPSESGVAGSSGGYAVPGGIPPSPPRGDGGDEGKRSSPVASTSRPRESRSTTASPAPSPTGKSEISAPPPGGGAERGSGGDEEAAGGRDGGGAQGAREEGEGQERRRTTSAPEVRLPPRSSPKHAPKA